MTITPELAFAITTTLIVVITSVGAVFKFLPGVVQKRVELSLAAETAKIKQDGDKLTADIEEQRATSALLLAMSGTLTAQSGNLDALTKAVVGQQTTQHANTQAIISLTEQGSETARGVDTLLDTGGPALQALIKTVDGMDGKLNAITTDSQTTATQNEVTRLKLEKLITDANQLFTHIQVFLTAAEAKLQDVKKKTGELPPVDKFTQLEPANPPATS